MKYLQMYEYLFIAYAKLPLSKKEPLLGSSRERIFKEPGM